MKLYVVGVGPGDPELLTIKAKRILEDSKTIFCPKGGKESIALSIVEKVVDIKIKD
jgi:precorrin-2/cobalt-factor-2 C20-methyltransferase